ncbi:MAG: hypothetical protein SNJ73_07980, partial [Acetobacteraceae bacterium]
MNIGPAAVGFMNRYHSIQRAPGSRVSALVAVWPRVLDPARAGEPPLAGADILAAGRGGLADPLIDVAHVEEHR